MIPAKEEEVEIEADPDLGNISGLFAAKESKETLSGVGNAEETHFVTSIKSGKTLDFCSSSKVKYANVLSGGDGFSTLVLLDGGRDSRIEFLVTVLKIKVCNYQRKEIPDTVDGVAYRTGPK